MFGITTRYDWLIDWEPAELRFTKFSDVPGRVQIGMEFEPALGTFVSKTLAALLVNRPALRATLARVSRINAIHGLGNALSLVNNELLELPERPATECSVETLAEFLGTLDVQLLHGDCIKGLGDYPVGNTMINIGHKTLFSPAQTPKMAFGRPSSFGLELPSEMLIPTLDTANTVGLEEFIIGEDSMIENTSIETEDRNRRPDGRGALLDAERDDDLLCTTAIPDRRSLNLPVQIFAEALRNNNIYVLPTLDRGQRDKTLPQFDRDGSGIVSDCGVGTFDRQDLTLVQFEHCRGHVTRGCDKGRGGGGILLAHRIIGQVMQSGLVDLLVGESNLECVISYTIDDLDSLNQINVGFYIQGYCPAHTKVISVEGISTFLQFLPRLKSWVSLEEYS